MYTHHYPHSHAGRPVPVAYPGLLTLFGSSIALASATLWGGARVVKRVVEGSLWESHPCGCSSHGCCACHCYHIECRPPCACHCHCCCGS